MNKNHGTMADMPIGDCKVDKKYKTFENGATKVYLTTKTEKRVYDKMVILEKEYTRVLKGRNKASILHMDIIIENGIKRKIAEYVLVEKQNDGTKIHRHKRVLDQGKILEDYIMDTCKTGLEKVEMVVAENRLNRVYK